MNEDLDRGWPTYSTLGSVPPNDVAKESLWRLLFGRYECSTAEIKAIIAALADDLLDGRRCETTIPGIVEALRGGEYRIALGEKPPLIINWMCYHIHPGLYSAERRQLAIWLRDALREALARDDVRR